MGFITHILNVQRSPRSKNEVKSSSDNKQGALALQRKHLPLSPEALLVLSTRMGLHPLWITVGDLLTIRPKATQCPVQLEPPLSSTYFGYVS